jgi:hypothetical protein
MRSKHEMTVCSVDDSLRAAARATGLAYLFTFVAVVFAKFVSRTV